MKSLYIKNFKNIRELKLPRIGRVNLIVGKNSVGKSTLLEAISLYLSNANDDGIKLVLNSRGETLARVMDDEREKLLDFILSNLEVEHFKGKFNKNREYPLVRFKDTKVALYDLDDIDSEMFNKLVQELEERGNGKHTR